MQGYGTQWSLFGVPRAWKRDLSASRPVHNFAGKPRRKVRVYGTPAVPGAGPEWLVGVAGPTRPRRLAQPPAAGSEPNT